MSNCAIGDDFGTTWAGVLPLDIDGPVEPSLGSGVVSIRSPQWTLGGKAHTSIQHVVLQVPMTRIIRFDKCCAVVLD